MSDNRLLERVTASDLFLLLWDDYGWSTDIGGLAILDGTSLLNEAVYQRQSGMTVIHDRSLSPDADFSHMIFFA